MENDFGTPVKLATTVELCQELIGRHDVPVLVVRLTEQDGLRMDSNMETSCSPPSLLRNLAEAFEDGYSMLPLEAEGTQ